MSLARLCCSNFISAVSCHDSKLIPIGLFWPSHVDIVKVHWLFAVVWIISNAFTLGVINASTLLISAWSQHSPSIYYLLVHTMFYYWDLLWNAVWLYSITVTIVIEDCIMYLTQDRSWLEYNNNPLENLGILEIIGVAAPRRDPFVSTELTVALSFPRRCWFAAPLPCCIPTLRLQSPDLHPAIHLPLAPSSAT